MSLPDWLSCESLGVDPGLAWIAVGGLALMGTLITLWGLRAARRALTLARTPTSLVAEVQPGVVEVSGIAEPLDGALRTPVGGEPCAWFELTLQRRHGHGSDLTEVAKWRTQGGFRLRDPTGVIDVDPGDGRVPGKGRVEAPRTEETRPESLEALPPGIRERAAGQEAWLKTSLESGPGGLSLVEKWIPPLTEVTVAGRAVRGPDGRLRIVDEDVGFIASFRGERAVIARSSAMGVSLTGGGLVLLAYALRIATCIP